MYGAGVTFFLADRSGRPVDLMGTDSSTSRFQTYSAIAQSTMVESRVLASAGVRPGFFSASATADTGTIFLRLSVQSDSQRNALALSTAYEKVLPAYITNFSTGDGTTLAVFERASAGGQPLSPNVHRNLLTGLALGLVLGVVTALVQNSLDTRLRTSAEVEESSRLPVLATIPLENRGRSLVVQSYPRSQRAEAIRQVRANLQFAALDVPLQVLVVTSAVPEEGKTAVASDLALACAEAGQSVIVVDADLRRPRLLEAFDVAAGPGLTDVLVGNADLEQCLRAHPGVSLQILTSGTLPARPSELLGSQAMAHLIDGLAARVDLVIIDSAPLLPVADTSSLLANVDAVLVVTRLNSTTRRQLRSAVERLRSFQTRIVGVVSNGGRTAESDGYYLPQKARSPFRRRRRPADLGNDEAPAPSAPALSSLSTDGGDAGLATRALRQAR